MRDELLQQSRWESDEGWATEGGMTGGSQGHQTFVPVGTSFPSSPGSLVLWTLGL